MILGSSEEKLMSELSQVAGRCGRREEQGHVYIQTQHTNHPLLKALKAYRQDDYLQALLSRRRQYHLPPYKHLACFMLRGEKNVMSRYMPELNFGAFEHAIVDGPIPYPPGNRRHQVCYQLVITSSSRQHRHQICLHIRYLLEKKLPKSIRITWQIDSHLSI